MTTTECRLALTEVCIEADVPTPIFFEIQGEKVTLVPEQDEECKKCPRAVQMPKVLTIAGGMHYLIGALPFALLI